MGCTKGECFGLVWSDMWGLWRNARIRAGLHRLVLTLVAVPRFVPAGWNTGGVRHHRLGDLVQPSAASTARRTCACRTPASRALNPENEIFALGWVNLRPCFAADIRRCTGGARPVHASHPPVLAHVKGHERTVRWQL